MDTDSMNHCSFGYATAEFEVTDERLGVYRPEEHSKYNAASTFELRPLSHKTLYMFWRTAVMDTVYITSRKSGDNNINER